MSTLEVTLVRFETIGFHVNENALTNFRVDISIFASWKEHRPVYN